MKSLLSVSIGLFISFFSNVYAADADAGKKLYELHCGACHGAISQGQRRLAPPLSAVKNHYLAVHDEELTFVDAIVDWVANPEEEKSLMKGAIRHFKLMPKIPVAEAEVTKIAEYIFSDDVTIPEAYKKHYAERHGGKPSRQYSRFLLRQFRLSPNQVDELKLTDKQLATINELITDKEIIMQPMREEVLRFNRQLQSMDSRSANFISELEILADVNAKRVEQMVKASGAARAKIEAVLDDNQYGMLLKFREALLKRLN